MNTHNLHFCGDEKYVDIASYPEMCHQFIHWILKQVHNWTAKVQTYSRGGHMGSLMFQYHIYFLNPRGWSGGAKVSCILHHRGIQLIWAYSWARPAVLVAGKGRVFISSVSSLYFCSSFFPVPLFHLFYYVSRPSRFSLSLGDDKMTHKGWHVIKPQHHL